MIIRFAAKKDKKQVLQLIAELMNNAYKMTGKPLISTKDLPQDIFEKLVKRGDVKIFVAEENDKLVGLATLYIIPIMRRTKPRGELEELVVTEDKRGQGIGRKLFEKVLQFCKENNVYSLKLSSYLELTKAHSFYEKLGGKTIERTFRFDIP